MQVIVFHRSHTRKGKSFFSELQKPISLPVAPESKPSTDEPQSQGLSNETQREDRITDGLSELHYELKEVTGGLRLTYKALWIGKIVIKEHVKIPLEPWSIYGIFFNAITGKAEVVESFKLNLSRNQMQSNFIGRVVVTDTDALVYLRGRIDNIPGFKNITVADDQDSSVAFTRYSSKVARFVQESNDRRVALSNVDIYKMLASLEAQMDVLTELVLTKTGTKRSELESLLKTAQANSAVQGNDAKKLKERIEYKKTVRKVNDSL